MDIDKAIEAYIESNCTALALSTPCCSSCKTSLGLFYRDELADKTFCHECLVRDLKDDMDALKDYFHLEEEL